MALSSNLVLSCKPSPIALILQCLFQSNRSSTAFLMLSRAFKSSEPIDQYLENRFISFSLFSQRPSVQGLWSKGCLRIFSYYSSKLTAFASTYTSLIHWSLYVKQNCSVSLLFLSSKASLRTWELFTRSTAQPYMQSSLTTYSQQEYQLIWSPL